MSLQAQLDELTARVEELLPAEKRAANERAIEELRGSGIAERALGVGGKAPEFELADGTGKVFRSRELLERGRLAICFYRGRWCPYCMMQLEALQQIWPQAQNAGATLVAISPQNPKHTALTAEQHHLKFPVLSDAGNKVARQFGLVYRVPEHLEAQYRKTFVNLPVCNGDESWELPLAATYVIERDGTVLFAEVEADYKRRAEPEEVLQVIRNPRGSLKGLGVLEALMEDRKREREL
jgi:peroxiredoxin